MNINSEEIKKAFENINYPTTKEEIIKHAEEQGTSENILNKLYRIRDKEYSNAAELSRQLNEY